MSDTSVTIAALEHSAREGSFTPIIGAGCSTLSHSGEPRHQLPRDIQQKALMIAARLDEDDVHHLNELIDLPPTTDDSSRVAFEPFLIDFHVALIKLDRFASMVFRHAGSQQTGDATRPRELWRRNPGSILSFPRSATEWNVPLLLSESWREFHQQLSVAISAASVIASSMRAAEWDRQGLGSKGIRFNLESLKERLFDEAGLPRPGASLALRDLVWIGDLLWHSLRFDLPYYPTSAELAFQFSLYALSATSAASQPPTLAQAAEAVSDSAQRLATWFQFYAQHPEPSRFYGVVARLLVHMFNRHSDTETYFRPRLSPIALTTNYDCEIETALRYTGSPYAVMIPVWLARRPHNSSINLAPLWLIKFVNTETERTAVAWHYGGSSSKIVRSNTEDSGPNFRPFPGPVVVKLHGSPTEALPDTDQVLDLPDYINDRLGRDKWTSWFVHRIVISETDYLRDMTHGLPYWLDKHVHAQRRRLFFLGHSISDWNLRLHITSNESEVDESELVPAPESKQFKRFAVNLASEFDRAVMSSLGIAQLTTDLEKMQRALEKVLTDGEAE